MTFSKVNRHQSQSCVLPSFSSSNYFRPLATIVRHAVLEQTSSCAFSLTRLRRFHAHDALSHDRVTWRTIGRNDNARASYALTVKIHQQRDCWTRYCKERERVPTSQSQLSINLGDKGTYETDSMELGAALQSGQDREPVPKETNLRTEEYNGNPMQTESFFWQKATGNDNKKSTKAATR